MPSVKTLEQSGFWPAVHAAMTQAFFTLSLGIGSIAICGSYVAKTQSLPQEATIIITLDTFVAICAGLIIFPSSPPSSARPLALRGTHWK